MAVFKGQCVSIKFGCKWVTGAGTLEVLEITVGVLAAERTPVAVWYYKFKQGVIRVENGRRWDVCRQAKHMKMWIEWRERVLENKKNI